MEEHGPFNHVAWKFFFTNRLVSGYFIDDSMPEEAISLEL